MPAKLRTPISKREKAIGRNKSRRQAQRFLSAFVPKNLIFRPCRYKTTSISHQHARADAFRFWQSYTAEIAD